MLSLMLPQNFKINMLMIPATDAAGRTGAYMSMKVSRKNTFLFLITQGNAATIALSVLQATSAAGAGAKALAGAVFKIWALLDTSLGDALAAQADAATFTTDAAVKNKLVAIEVDSAQMDIAGGFAYLAPVTGASNVANLTACVGIESGLRFPQAAPLTVFV